MKTDPLLSQDSSGLLEMTRDAWGLHQAQGQGGDQGSQGDRAVRGCRRGGTRAPSSAHTFQLTPAQALQASSLTPPAHERHWKNCLAAPGLHISPKAPSSV